MKTKTALLVLATTPVVCAGNPEPACEPVKAEPWLSPSIDIRARYEFADVDGFDPSHAFTTRERLGVKTKAWNGFSAMLEGEFLQALVDDYHAGAPGADPFDPSNSLIADPENHELNQAFLQYEGFDTTVKIGRHRIIYDNSAFVSNGSWRQNEQTFDAISFSNQSVADLTLDYAYVNQVNRLFGSAADAPLVAGPPPFGNVQDLAANVHLFNASYAGIEGITLGSYAYIMDFQNKENWNNNTFGASAKGDLLGLTLYGELAWQDDAGYAANDDALYTHVTATKTLGVQTITVGIEHLDAGFKLPLGTSHPFNGYADSFVAGRVEGTHNGLTDIYVSHTMPLFCGIKWFNALHAFGDNGFSSGYGWEYDSMLTKKFDDHFTAVAGLSCFESGGDAFVGIAGLPTTSRFTLELNYTF
jgi:hypothetical protein